MECVKRDLLGVWYRDSELYSESPPQASEKGQGARWMGSESAHQQTVVGSHRTVCLPRSDFGCQLLWLIFDDLWTRHKTSARSVCHIRVVSLLCFALTRKTSA